MKKFCKFLRDHAIKITKLKKKKFITKGHPEPRIIHKCKNLLYL